MARSARLEIGLAALEEHIAERQHQSAIRRLGLQHLDLMLQFRALRLQVSALLCRVSGRLARSIGLAPGLIGPCLLLGAVRSGRSDLILGGVRFACTGKETGTLALRAQSRSLIFG